MKPFIALSLALSACLTTAQAQFLVNDTWKDGTRDDPAAPAYSESGTDSDADGDLESSWFNGGGGTLDVVGGKLQGTVAAGSSSTWTTYFAPEASPVTLGNAGDQLRITWTFSLSGVDTTPNTSQNFRLAVVDSPESSRLVGEGASGSDSYLGYAMFMNMATTFGRSTPFRLNERVDGSNPGNFLSSSGNWASALADDGGTGDTGYEDGLDYTFVFSATRTASGELQLVVTMAGGNIGNDGMLEVSALDDTPNTFTFDTFGIRPSSGDTTADVFNTSLFQVEFIPVPEPSSMLLLAAGLGLFATLRRKRA